MASITFLGAAGTVTGSKYLIEGNDRRILVDCGMFQGDRNWNEKNWQDPPCDLASIDAVLLTHAHIDHVGLLPRYVRMGLKCPVYATAATRDLSTIVLTDSAHLQVEEAEYRAAPGRSRHNPALPLYEPIDARNALAMFKAVEPHQKTEIFPGITATWRRMGHILGACSIELTIDGKRINFSGDIGRYTVPILRDPEPVPFGDVLLIESTYGTSLHPRDPAENLLESVVNATHKRGGVVVIPAFAVGRTQHILFLLRELKDKKRIPDLPVIVDSPMASDATMTYAAHPDDYDEEALGILQRGNKPFMPSALRFVSDRSESIRLNSIDQPMIIISASGMLTGGRVLHHLLHRISSPLNTILLVGFQPPGGRGAWLQSGAKKMRLMGQEVQVRAQIATISSLSAHGDRDEMVRWCRESTGKPGKVFVVHGEPESASGFKAVLEKELGWNVEVAKYLQKVEL